MKFEYWQSLTGGMYWYWHLKADNGKVVADGGEGYVSEYGGKEAIERFKHKVADADVLPLKH